MCEGCQIEKYIWKNHEGKQYCVGCWNKKKLELGLLPVKPSEPIKLNSVTETEGSIVKSDGSPMVYKKAKSRFPKPISLKRKEEQREYSVERVKFLEEHEFCEASIRYICTHMSSEIHHKKGRTGDLYLDKDNWLAVCRACHEWIELNPQKAKELGYSKSRLEKE